MAKQKGEGALQLNTEVWLLDAVLRDHTPYDRGVLVDLMCLAHRGEPYGFLVQSDRPLSDKMIARTAGIELADWKETSARLIETGRIKSTGANKPSFYIPKMVKDGAVRQAAREGGSKGGNLALGGSRSEPRSKVITFGYLWNCLPTSHQSDEMKEAMQAWWEFRQRKRVVFTKPAVSRAVSVLVKLSPEEAITWIWCAHDKQWRGLYPPPQGYSSDPTAMVTSQPKTRKAKAKKSESEFGEYCKKLSKLKTNLQIWDVICNAPHDLVHQLEKWAVTALDFKRP